MDCLVKPNVFLSVILNGLSVCTYMEVMRTICDLFHVYKGSSCYLNYFSVNMTYVYLNVNVLSM